MKQPMALLLAVAAALPAGCGGDVIDPEAAEEDVRRGFAERGVIVQEVDCPSGVDAEAGASYECTAESARARFLVTYRQLDDSGRVSAPRIERLEPPG